MMYAFVVPATLGSFVSPNDQMTAFLEAGANNRSYQCESPSPASMSKKGLREGFGSLGPAEVGHPWLLPPHGSNQIQRPAPSLL